MASALAANCSSALPPAPPRTAWPGAVVLLVATVTPSPKSTTRAGALRRAAPSTAATTGLPAVMTTVGVGATGVAGAGVGGVGAATINGGGELKAAPRPAACMARSSGGVGGSRAAEPTGGGSARMRAGGPRRWLESHRKTTRPSRTAPPPMSQPPAEGERPTVGRRESSISALRAAPGAVRGSKGSLISAPCPRSCRRRALRGRLRDEESRRRGRVRAKLR